MDCERRLSRPWRRALTKPDTFLSCRDLSLRHLYRSAANSACRLSCTSSSVLGLETKMHRKSLATLVCLVVIGSSLAATGRPPVTQEMKQTVKVYNKLGEKIFKDLSNRDGNIFISPLSVSAIVGMVYLGAKGKTAEEIEGVLDIKKNNLSSVQLHMGFMKLIESLRSAVKDFNLELANGVFVRDGLLIMESYKKDLEKYYLSGLYSAGFREKPEEAMRDLNAWVQDSTNDKIPQLLERPLPSNIPLVALNAVYFKGNWQLPFNTSDTKREKFNGASGSTEVNMMHQEETFVHVETKDYQAVELPYESEDVVMVILLPKEGTSLRNLEQSINYADVRDKLGSVVRQKVELSIPKFSLSKAYDMRGPLENIGVLQIFDPRRANLTGIARVPVIVLDSLLHKAIIDVNEKGSVAAAVTGGIHSHSVIPTDVAVFKADRPFLFLIEDLNTNAVLFVGRVNDIDNVEAGIKGQG